jgi:hypothetical protein
MKFNQGGQHISARLFSWDNGEGCAEISDLGPDFRMHQVWDDSCDIGFTIMSERTIELRTFVETGRDTDREGELLATHFTSLNANGRIDKSKSALTITLFND